MTEKRKIKKTSKKRQKNSPHDGLFKKVMENPVAARELLDEYLPASFKNQVDLATIKLEKESFVEKNLKKQLSDVVLSVKTKDNDEAFVYMLLEAQVDPDYWIALRLWKYILLLCERHSKGRKKLPLICPLVFYHGSKKYNAPRNFWELFTKPKEAKDLLGDNYQLVDLQAMSDDKINYEKHLSIILYMMKHAHQRDKLKLVEDIFKNCTQAIFIDKQQGYVYTKLMIWYNDCKVPLDKKQEFEQLILDYLPEEDSEEIMKTIADGYIEEGINKGIILGKARGIEQGMEQGMEKVALNMLRQKLDQSLISSVTGLSADEILKLKSKL